MLVSALWCKFAHAQYLGYTFGGIWWEVQGVRVCGCSVTCVHMLSTGFFGGISEFLEVFVSWQKKFFDLWARSPVVMSSGSLFVVLVLLSTLGPAPRSHSQASLTCSSSSKMKVLPCKTSCNDPLVDRGSATGFWITLSRVYSEWLQVSYFFPWPYLGWVDGVWRPMHAA